VEEAVASITEEDILRRIAVLADDSTRGRATPSPELEEVAQWIAGEFAALGLQPGGDGESFIQRYPIPESEGETAPNVVGILPGSDPELREEYVVYSAHMDHVGVRRPDETGDSIYNGADDDASGTATVMEVAEAMSGLPVAPRRSVIFLLVSGEERGLWGSEYFAEHPPVPVDLMVTNLNADMVGRNWTDTIVAIGREHSSLGETLARVNERHPELGMTAIDDIWPDERFYFRSDHYNFARKGVPVLFFFNGVHEDYHRPSDEVDLIDGDKTARIGRLLFLLGLDIADAAERPQWNPDSYEEIVEGAD
jgi:Zn-dependent M28 family amino/carboxypeptidase